MLSSTVKVCRKLADALNQFGLEDMAERAMEGFYSDFDSPLPAPKTSLVEELEGRRESIADDQALNDLIADIRAGDFDG